MQYIHSVVKYIQSVVQYLQSVVKYMQYSAWTALLDDTAPACSVPCAVCSVQCAMGRVQCTVSSGAVCSVSFSAVLWCRCSVETVR